MFRMTEVEEREEESRLGRKEYWDDFYKTEINNLDEFGDEGEVWFGKQWERRIGDWLCDSKHQVAKNRKLCDIGCGNGSLLKFLSMKGFTNLHGMDYSDGAVQLASKVLGERASVSQGDMLDSQSLVSNGLSDCDILIDKGTWDAISLRNDSTQALELYKNTLIAMITNPKDPMTGKRGLFIVVSCNFTSEELKSHFESDWTLIDSLPAPSFSFGGISGNTVTGLVFEKR